MTLVEEILSTPRGELALYHSFADKLSQGMIPYGDFFPEYPPFSLPIFWLANVLGYRWFTLIYYVLVASFAGLLAFLIHKKGGNSYIFLAAVLPLGGLFWDRFDIFPAFFAFLAIYLMKKNVYMSSLSLSIGFLIKVFPAVLLPIVFFSAWKQKKSIEAMSLFVFPIIAVLGTITLLGGSFKKLIEFQGNRGIQIESSRATPLLLQHLLYDKELIVEYNHYTFEVREK